MSTVTSTHLGLSGVCVSGADQSPIAAAPANGATPAAVTCDECGAPARVHILHEYGRIAPNIGHYCLLCVDRVAERETSESLADDRGSRPSAAACVLFSGIVFGIAGAVGELLQIHGSPGFGWYQRYGAALGALIAVSGGVLRMDYCAIGGALVFALAAGADLLATPQSSTLNWWHIAAIAFGLALILAGLLIARSRDATGALAQRDNPCQA